MGTPHDHPEHVPGCFRCDLSRAEAERVYAVAEQSLRADGAGDRTSHPARGAS